MMQAELVICNWLFGSMVALESKNCSNPEPCLSGWSGETRAGGFCSGLLYFDAFINFFVYM